MNTSRLIRLSSQLDQVLEFRYLPDGTEVDEMGNPVHAAAAGVAGVGAVGGGLYARGRLAQARTFGPQAPSGVRSTIGQGASALGSDASRIGRSVVANTGRAGAYAGGLGKAGWGGLKELLAKLKGVKFSSKEDNLIQLSSKLDDILM